tara:strand:- start:181 stop:489 length:309 start_codon:yes stop_codon:yes gene_type:complete
LTSICSQQTFLAKPLLLISNINPLANEVRQQIKAGKLTTKSGLIGLELLAKQTDSDDFNVIHKGKNKAPLIFSTNNVSSLVCSTEDGLNSCSTAEPKAQNDV